MLDTLLPLVAIIGLGAGAFMVARSPKFWFGMGKELFHKLLPFLLKFFDNRPKSPEEWAEWRKLSQMKPSEMSAKERERFKELKRLNAEYRDNK